MQNIETKGLVLFTRNYKEKDKLVKIFTRDQGKRMFFIRNTAKSTLIPSLQPFNVIDFTARINTGGFSFMSDISKTHIFKNIDEDIFMNAHASYMISLADTAIPDNQADEKLYDFLLKNLQLLEQGFDEEIITNIFELQALSYFGAQVNLFECCICHTKNVAFDYSFKYDGCLCKEHLNLDERRLHLDPNVIYFSNIFLNINLEQLKEISLKDDMKKKIRLFIDELYEEYTGVQLKAKKFLDDMDSWAKLMK
jgi:DNA repair protein RecO